MDTDYNATTFHIDTFGIDANRYGDDLGPTSCGQGLCNGGTWPMAAAVDSNDLTLSPKFDPTVVHSYTVPAISIDGPCSFDSGLIFNISPSSFANPSFHSGIHALHRDDSCDTFSQQSDGYCSMLPSLQNWEDSSQLSDGNHSMFRSHSFGGSSDTQLMDGLQEMTTSSTTLQAQSLPSRFEDGLY